MVSTKAMMETLKASKLGKRKPIYKAMLSSKTQKQTSPSILPLFLITAFKKMDSDHLAQCNKVKCGQLFQQGIVTEPPDDNVSNNWLNNLWLMKNSSDNDMQTKTKVTKMKDLEIKDGKGQALAMGVLAFGLLEHANTDFSSKIGRDLTEFRTKCFKRTEPDMTLLTAEES